jgi:hypothetical protein
VKITDLKEILVGFSAECRKFVSDMLDPVAKRLDAIEQRPIGITKEQLDLAIAVALREVQAEVMKHVDVEAIKAAAIAALPVERLVGDAVEALTPKVADLISAATSPAILGEILRPMIPAPVKGDPGEAPGIDEILKAAEPAIADAVARKVLDELPDERIEQTVQRLLPAPVKGDKGDPGEAPAIEVVVQNALAAIEPKAAEQITAAVERATEALRAELPGMIPAPLVGPIGPAPTDEQVARAAAAYLELSPPEPGPQGEPGVTPSPEDLAVAVRAYFEANPIEDGADGQDATDEQVEKAVAAYLVAHPIEDGAPGADATDEQVERILTGYLQRNPIVGQKGDTGPPPDVDVIEAIVTKHSARWQLEFERIARDFLQASVDKFPRPKDGRDAIPVDGFDVKIEGRTMTLTLRPADPDLAPIVREVKLQTIEYRGIWKEGEYDTNDVVTWAGSAFIANRPTKSKPETDESWRLFVKRGRDGKDQTPPKATGPVRV